MMPDRPGSRPLMLRGEPVNMQGPGSGPKSAPRVQLTEDAKRRIAEMQTPKPKPKAVAKPATRPAPRKPTPASEPEMGVREGRNANIDDDVRARAMKAMAAMNPEPAEEAYAKGGKVRGWGKARGGRSAKII